MLFREARITGGQDCPWSQFEARLFGLSSKIVPRELKNIRFRSRNTSKDVD